VESVTIAEADFVESARLVAVMVTVCCVVMFAGAVYKPSPLIVPDPAGLIVQLTDVSPALATVAVNDRLSPLCRVALPGVILTATAGGRSVTVADATFVGSAWLAAVTVTVS
jgi:hypothetical protein